jgi:hypothetical protein
MVSLLSVPAWAQYHAGSRECDPLLAHTPSADVAAQDLDPSPLAKQFENSNIQLDIPVTNYLDETKYNADLSESFVKAGTVSIQKDGAISLNGEAVKPQTTYSTECQ